MRKYRYLYKADSVIFTDAMPQIKTYETNHYQIQTADELLAVFECSESDSNYNELIEALKQIANEYDGEDPDNYYSRLHRCRNIARKAIAKARGDV